MPPDSPDAFTPVDDRSRTPEPSARSRARPGLFTNSPNARSKSITYIDGAHTHGALNQIPSRFTAYQVGVSEDTGQRRTMEDAYSFVVDFGGVRGQGYFAIFDGHAGKHAAEWCGAHFHEVLLETLEEKEKEKDNGGEGGASVPEIMNSTFHQVDFKLSQLAESGETHSGCTAVTAFLRLEDINGGQAFVLRGSSTSPTASTRSSISSASPSKLKSVLKSISPNSNSNSSTSTSATSSTIDPDSLPSSQQSAPIEPPYDIRRVLYLANVGDARAVLSRGGKAVRLTYDHKGSDKQEARRIKEAGGFVMNNRVNGVLAVTRSLGDSSMKEFVVGSPYTTETELGDDDEFLIMACDGLWDVVDDQKAIDLIHDIPDAQKASQILVDYALAHFSTDNVSVLVVKFGSAEA